MDVLQATFARVEPLRQLLTEIQLVELTHVLSAFTAQKVLRPNRGAKADSTHIKQELDKWMSVLLVKEDTGARKVEMRLKSVLLAVIALQDPRSQPLAQEEDTIQKLGKHIAMTANHAKQGTTAMPQAWEISCSTKTNTSVPVATSAM